MFNFYGRNVAALTAALALTGCMSSVIQSNVPECERLIPDAWRKPIEPASLPVPEKLADGHDDARPWQKGFVEQTGQLEKESDQKVAIDHIYRECLMMHRDAVKKAKGGLFSRIFG